MEEISKHSVTVIDFTFAKIAKCKRLTQEKKNLLYLLCRFSELSIRLDLEGSSPHAPGIPSIDHIKTISC